MSYLSILVTLVVVAVVLGIPLAFMLYGYDRLMERRQYVRVEEDQVD